MVTTEDRMKILRLLQEGRISPEAAAELLQTLDREDVPPVPPMPPVPPVSGPVPVQEPLPAQPYVAHQETTRQETDGPKPHWLRVRVTDTNSGKPRVNVRMPLGLVSLGLKLGQRYAPEIEGINMDELLHAAKFNGPGPLVDVYDHEDGEHVEVFLE